MSATNFNLDSLRSRTFLGYIQFQQPGSGTYYRMKERQQMTITFDFQTAAHYNDSGSKFLDPSGINHKFTVGVKVTSDLFDTETNWSSSPPTDSKTLSYWIYQWTQMAPLTITFVAAMQALSGPEGDPADKYISLSFNLVPTTFGPITYSANGGAQDLTISGEILSINALDRQGSAP